MNTHILIQKILPKHFITRFFGYFAEKKMGFLTTLLINMFIKRYNVNMAESSIQDVKKFKTFNEFFTRKLKKDSREISCLDDYFISPCDGTISEFGTIKRNKLLQAKNHNYTVESLIGENYEQYNDGSYITIYLSPSDYHRVHMPQKGKVERMTFFPGNLYSVSPSTTQHIPELFARNERLVCFFKNKNFVQVLVGATIVGSIETVWEKNISNQGRNKFNSHDYKNENIQLNRGDEMGLFKLGSTVILLFPKDKITFEDNIKHGCKIKMGQPIAKLRQGD